jgi:hypothetical protein
MKYLLSIVLIISVLYQSAHSRDFEEYGIKQGQRVRVEIDTIITKHFLLLIHYNEAGKMRIKGDISFDSSDSIALSIDKQKSQVRHIAKSEIKRIWVNEGKRRPILDGALIGGWSAGGLNSVFSGILNSGDGLKWERVATFAIGGAVIGTLIGSRCKVDKWREIKTDKLSSTVSLGFAKKDFRLVAAIHF